MNAEKNPPSLPFCILMDAVGMLSYIFPALEFADILWAPVSACVFYRTFGGKAGKIGGFIAFFEEILPFTDILPTFSLGYLYWKLTR